MNRRLVATALIMVLLLFVGQSATAGSAPFAVTVQQAYCSAGIHLSKQAVVCRPHWKGASIGTPIRYNYVDGEPAVFVFPVLASGDPAGYITVSADNRQVPVIESSGQGTAPGQDAKADDLVFVPPYGSALQQCLHIDMGGPPVTFAGAEEGVERHANTQHYEGIYSIWYECNYHFDACSALSYDGSKNSWFGFKREINADRPPMVYHDYWYKGDPEFKYHWMTGVGFFEDTGLRDRAYYVNDCHGVAQRYFDYDAYTTSIAWLYIFPAY